MSHRSGIEIATGILESFLFVSSDENFAIANFEMDDETKMVCKGNLAAYPLGSYLEIHGKKEFNPKHKAEEFTVAVSMPAEPTATSHGLRKFIAANFKHVGKVASAKIVKHFGDLTISTLDEDPKAVDDVKGLNRLMRESIKNQWQKVRENHSGIRSIVLAMHDERVGKASVGRATKVFNKMIEDGKDVHGAFIHSPYKFFDEIDVGFLLADKIALRLGYPADGSERVIYGTLYQLEYTMRSGDTAAPLASVLNNTARFLGVSEEKAQETIAKCEERRLVARIDLDSGSYLQPWRLHMAEKDAAHYLVTINNEAGLWIREAISIATENAQKIVGIEFNEDQMQAIRYGVEHGVSIVTGGPGTGKTTTLKGIVQALIEVSDQEPTIKLLAPTGKAAKRMHESTGIEAKTIHREMALAAQKGGTIDAQIIIVDEASMTDIELFCDLLSHVKRGSKVIIIGDVDQLPSIGPGRVLADLIESGLFSVTRLKRAYRFNEGQIKANAARINAGEAMEFASSANPSDGDDCYFVNSEDSSPGLSPLETLAQRVVRMHATHIPARKGADPVNDIQTLVPMRVGPIGANALNLRIRDAVNPLKNQKTITVFKKGPVKDKIQTEEQEAKADKEAENSITFREGDKVMQTSNNYDIDVFNGETGVIRSINPKDGIARVFFGDRMVNLNKNDLQSLELAYAMTIHKSQGSEYPYVIMPISPVQAVMLERTTIYTGTTRAKSMLVMMGSINALETGIRLQKSNTRTTFLIHHIKQALANGKG